MKTARCLVWDLIATKVTRLGTDVGIWKVPDEAYPQPFTDVCAKFVCLSEWMAPSVNWVSGALSGKLETPFEDMKLA